MAAVKISRIGFGQVEPNHLSAQRTGQIYAQLPAGTYTETIDEEEVTKKIDILENGQFVKYDYANNMVDFTGAGEWMMVFNEVKLYDERKQLYRYFAQQRKDYTPDKYEEYIDADTTQETSVTHYGLSLNGQMVPRVIKVNVGDIWTTNTLELGNTDGDTKVNGTEDIDVGTVLAPNSKGYLSTTGDLTHIKIQVVKVYDLADGQKAVKVMRIA